MATDSKRSKALAYMFCIREDLESDPHHSACPSRAIQGLLTAENHTLLEGLMLLWDEMHQSAKELDQLSRKVEGLQDAINLLPKDKGGEEGGPSAEDTALASKAENNVLCNYPVPGVMGDEVKEEDRLHADKGKAQAASPVFDLLEDDEDKTFVREEALVVQSGIYPEIIEISNDEDEVDKMLIGEIFGHPYFGQGEYLDLKKHTQKEWEDNFHKGFKNRANNLKHAKSSQSTPLRCLMLPNLCSLPKIPATSSLWLRRQWYELEKKEEIKAFLAEKCRARCQGESLLGGEDRLGLDMENLGGEYQMTMKAWWDALSSDEQSQWNEEVQKIECSVADNRAELPFVMRPFLELLCLDNVIGPAMCYFYVVWRTEDGRHTVWLIKRCANKIDGRSLQDVVTSQEVGATSEECKYAWGSCLAREAAMLLPDSLAATQSKTDTPPPFVPFDKTKCTPDQQYGKGLNMFVDHSNPTTVLPWQELSVTLDKFYNQQTYKFPVALHDYTVTPYNISECIMLLEYLEKECIAGSDHPFQFYASTLKSCQPSSDAAAVPLETVSHTPSPLPSASPALHNTPLLPLPPKSPCSPPYHSP
ncbi:hypothetical protein IW262DRAFT_1456173 [Armillaria fumosa]|nr:hypothetical protein IW262DRAFT_1456173 [Armillaria fumosa]